MLRRFWFVVPQIAHNMPVVVVPIPPQIMMAMLASNDIRPLLNAVNTIIFVIADD